MKRILILTPAVLLLEFLAFCGWSRPAVQAAEESSQELKQQIRKLEEKVAALQRKLDSLQSKPRNWILESKAPCTPCPPSNRMPRGSKPFKFNGMQFWIMPVQSDGQAKSTNHNAADPARR